MAQDAAEPNSLVGVLKGLCSCMDNKKQSTGDTGMYKGLRDISTYTSGCKSMTRFTLLEIVFPRAAFFIIVCYEVAYCTLL